MTKENRQLFAILALESILAGTLCAQNVSVTGRVKATGRVGDAANMVVWLVPAERTAPAKPPASVHYKMTQKDKHFEPHLLVVPVGSAVEFPNLDPWFHNVFSLFEGKRFDLGLYEAGSTRTVHFDKAGISYIFCNIHPEMSAVVVVVPTSYSAISDRKGLVTIPDVPPDKYMVHFWQEDASADDLRKMTRELDVGATPSLGVVQAPRRNVSQHAHKNKYGEEYPASTPSAPVYAQ